MTQNTLTDEVKTFIVQQLACYDGLTDVVRLVKENFDLVVSHQQVEAYDPNKRAGRALSEEYRTIFAETRKTFLEDTASLGIAQRVVRLKQLQRMADAAEARKNYPLVASLLEQAAKEMGGAFTNRREITGKDGAAVQIISAGMSPKEAAEAYAQSLASRD